jgi:hypothetical protein
VLTPTRPSACPAPGLPDEFAPRLGAARRRAVARSGPAAARSEAAGKGLGAREGPSIPLLGAPRLPAPSRQAAPSGRDPRPPPKPDAVSATSSSASRSAGPAPRPHAPLASGGAARSARDAGTRPCGGLRGDTPARGGWARRRSPHAAPGARTLARPGPAPQPLELLKVAHAAGSGPLLAATAPLAAMRIKPAGKILLVTCRHSLSF